MGRSLFLALEDELEINKLQEAEAAAAKTGEYEILYDNLSNDQKVTEELEKKNKEGLFQSGTPPDGEVVETISNTEEESDLEIAKEHFRNLSYSSEDFSDENTYSSSSNQDSLIGSVGSAIMAALSSLAHLGITYGPKVIKSVYRGVLYAFGALAKLLYESTVALDRYIDRRINSFSNLKQSIASLKKSVDMFKEKSVNDPSVQYSNLKVINSLKAGNSVDFTANIKRLEKFITNTVNGLDRDIRNEIGAITHLIAYSHSTTAKVPNSLMSVRHDLTGMNPGSVEGYEVNGNLTESFKYSEPLPSDVVLIAQLPRTDLQSFEEISQAYNASKLYLGIDVKSFNEVSSIDYMTAQALSEFLDELDRLCDTCIAHQSFYEKIKHQKANLRISFKNYFLHLVGRDHKVSLKNSLVENIYLKSMFIDKVYMTAAMDIHDYAAKVIANGLSFVEDNVKKLSS